MSVYLVDPLDTQFFRTNLPFDAGVDGYAISEFMPSPRTVYGALRAAGFAHSHAQGLTTQDGWHEVWGSFTEKGSLSLKGPFLYEKAKFGSPEIILPLPADLVVQEQNGEDRVLFNIPRLSSALNSCSDLDLELRSLMVLGRVGDEKIEDCHVEFMLPSSFLDWYLTQGHEPITTINLRSINDDLFAAEPRVGIQRSLSTRVADEGQLYVAIHYRPRTAERGTAGYDIKTVGYCCHLNGLGDGELGDQGVLRLGGESRPAHYRRAPDTFPTRWMHTCTGEQDGDLKALVVEKIISSGRFKLYMITPGLFGGRWHPFYEENNKILTEIPECGMKARLQAVALRGSKLVGGWNIHQGIPKPLVNGVRAGSVYFFELEDWRSMSHDEKEKAAQQVYEHFHFQSLCRVGQDQGLEDEVKEGFGIALTGGWDYVREG